MFTEDMTPSKSRKQGKTQQADASATEQLPNLERLPTAQSPAAADPLLVPLHPPRKTESSHSGPNPTPPPVLSDSLDKAADNRHMIAKGH